MTYHSRFSFRLGIAAAVLLVLSACTDRTSPLDSLPTEPVASRTDASTQQSGRVLVRLAGRDDEAEIIRLVEELGGRVVRRYQRLPYVSVKVPDGSIDRLRQSSRVVAVTPVENDAPHLDKALVVIGAPQVRAAGYTGQGTTIAILDDGIDRNHPFYRHPILQVSRVVREACYSTADEASEVSLCPDGSSEQSGPGSASNSSFGCREFYFAGPSLCDHGAHVAGIAAGWGGDLPGAPASGVAPGANIIAVQVFHRQNNAAACMPRPAPCLLTSSDDQLAALESLLLLRLFEKTNLAAINMSLGSRGAIRSACDSDPRADVILELRQANVATVISAGNEGHIGAVGRPACISSAITVGATDNEDNVADFSNRSESLLDLFAPGVGIISSIASPGFGPKNGTSMAAPMVAGAFGVMRERFPFFNVEVTRDLLRQTGRPISYVDAGGTTGVTPRLQLAAALSLPGAPKITVQKPAITVLEGSTVKNGGSVSDPEGTPVSLSVNVGNVVLVGESWTWAWRADDTNGPLTTVAITVTDADGLTATTTFTVTVENAAPAITITSPVPTSMPEGGELPVSIALRDPGANDGPLGAWRWCHDQNGSQLPLFDPPSFAGSVQNGELTASHSFVGFECEAGDNGNFWLTVRAWDADGDTSMVQRPFTVYNVAPTVLATSTQQRIVNGQPVRLVSPGQTVSFTALASDPGSDDLTFRWDWDDNSIATRTSFVSSSNTPDLLPSPGIRPRTNVEDRRVKSWVRPCLYRAALRVSDDDGGSVTQDFPTVVVGTATSVRTAAWWNDVMRQPRLGDVPVFVCQGRVIHHLSKIFAEVRGTLTLPAMQGILSSTPRDVAARLDRELLAIWLNFAAGALGWDALVDTSGDGRADTRLSDAIAAAESVRANPRATAADLQAQTDKLRNVNAMGR